MTVMRTALLYEEGLFADARRDLEQAAAADRREATVRFLLGHVYEHIGLTGKAVRAFDEAAALAGDAAR